MLTQDLVTQGILWLLPAGFITGAFGAFGLAAAARLLVLPSRGRPGAFAWTALTAAVGGVAGSAFVTICFFGAAVIFAAWPAAFAVWQGAVGLAIRRHSS